MFKKKTLIIVGAGANAGSGKDSLLMPTGKELADRISKLLDIRFADGVRMVSGDFSIYEALKIKNGRGNMGEYGAAARFISGNMAIARSIDNFIEAQKNKPNVQICGKLAIFKSILDSERAGPLYLEHGTVRADMLRRTSTSWLARFLEYLILNVSTDDLEDALSRVEIVCFNYDRCIEHYLVQALDNYYDVGVDAAQGLVKKIRIFHPYGTVGNLGWQDVNTSRVYFGQKIEDPRALLAAIEGIKTFSERIDDKDTILEIRRAVESAETIIFLGFSFYNPNMKLMLKDVEPKATRIFGTAYGFSPADTETIKFELQEFFPDAFKIELRNDLSASKFFDEYQRSLSA